MTPKPPERRVRIITSITLVPLLAVFFLGCQETSTQTNAADAAPDSGALDAGDDQADLPTSCTEDRDCAGLGFCYQNVCTDTFCRPGSVSCQGKDIVQCSEDGNNTVVLDTCMVRERCHRGQCQALVCIPGEAICEGNARSLCNDEGTGSTLRPCQGEQICFAGACMLPACEEDQATCLDDRTAGLCQGGGFIPRACGEGSRCQDTDCVPFYALSFTGDAHAEADLMRPPTGSLSLWLVQDQPIEGTHNILRWGGLNLQQYGQTLSLQHGQHTLIEATALAAPGQAFHIRLAWTQDRLSMWYQGALVADIPWELAPAQRLTLGAPFPNDAAWPGRLMSLVLGQSQDPTPQDSFIPRCDDLHEADVVWRWPLDQTEGDTAWGEPEGAPALRLTGTTWAPGALGLYARDADQDGWAFAPEAVLACGPINDDDLLRLGDCNDGNPRIAPDLMEQEDRIDNDCDDIIDEGI